MSTLKVNNLEPTSGTVVIINADTKIISATGKEIDLGGATNDFSGSLNVTGSITNINGDIIVNKGNFQLKSGSLFIGSGSLGVGYTSGSSSSQYWNLSSSVTVTGSFETSGSSDFGGNVTVTGSFETTGSSDFDGDVTVTGSFETTGSVTLTGSLDVQGDSTVTGDMIISGCFDIACYQDADNPVFYGIEGRTTPSAVGFEYISINYSTYGNLTVPLSAAATASNQLIYVQSASVIVPYAVAGISFDIPNQVTYVSASGPDIPTGTIVQIGFPQPLAGVTSSIAYGTGSSTPVASFCCEEITLYSDVVISGSLDVFGPTNLHDGLIVSGCIEMYCPGDETTAFYGYKGNTRFSKSSASVFLNYGYLNASYGNVTASISASAAANAGTLQVYNASVGTTQTAPFVRATWTGQITLIEYATNTLTNFGNGAPGPVIVVGNALPNLQPFGADTLMGTGSLTPVQTAQFCCDGNILFGDSTMSGSLTVTDGATVTGSVTISGSASDDSVEVQIPIRITKPVTITGPLTVSGSIIDDKVDIKIPVDITSPIRVSGSLTIASGSLFDGKGGGKVTGSFEVTGSLTANTITATNTLVINNVLSSKPLYSGSKGETLYVVSGSQFLLYAFLNETWRSSSLA